MKVQMTIDAFDEDEAKEILAAVEEIQKKRALPAPIVGDVPVRGVYFARAGEAVKIGWSSYVSKRIRELQTGCPVGIELLAVVEGADIFAKRALHVRFGDDSVGGKWFAITPRLVTCIRNAREAFDARAPDRF